MVYIASRRRNRFGETKLDYSLATTPNTYPKYITYGSSMTGQFPTKTTLASGVGDLTDCCADATHVYFCDYTGNRVGRVAIGGGTPEYIATGLNGAMRICIDTTNVYVSIHLDAKIVKINKTTLVKTELIPSGYSFPEGLSCDATNVYFSTGAGKIGYVPIAGGAVVELAAGSTPLDVTVDATNVYFCDYTANKICKVPIAGGAVTDLATGITGLHSIIVDGTNVYFADISAGKISYVPIAGGAVVNLYDGTRVPALCFNSDKTKIFFVEAHATAGKLCRVDIATKTVDVLAAGLINPLFGVYCANNMVYCAERGGTITSYPETPNASIRNIDGKDYLQVEKANTENILYNESFDTVAYWSGLMSLTVTANQAVSPIGTLTMASIVENATTGYHGIYKGSLSLSAPRIFSIFVKTIPGSATRYLRLQTDGSSNDTFFDAVTGTFTRLSGLHTGHFAYSVGNGIWHIGFCTTATATYYCLAISDSPDTTHTHLGDGVSGYYIWGASIQNGYYSQSYIQTTSAAETRTKTTAYFPSAVVPSWLRDGFTVDVIPEYSSDQLASAGGSRYITAFDDATETISIYLDSAGKINIVGSVSGSKLQTSAHTWTVNQTLSVYIRANSSGVSKVITSGFTTGNNTYTGTTYSTSSGNVYWGMDKNQANQIDGLISEPYWT